MPPGFGLLLHEGPWLWFFASVPTSSLFHGPGSWRNDFQMLRFSLRAAVMEVPLFSMCVREGETYHSALPAWPVGRGWLCPAGKA